MIKVSSFLLALLALAGCSREGENHNSTATSASPLEILMAGNQRYTSQHAIHPHQGSERMRELKSGQHPFAVVVCCSDSRVSPEILFDQGLGDIFVVRTAGNIIGDYELGSIEYAVEHLHASLVVVMGHENCGAISAFLEHRHDKRPLYNHIQNIIDYIKEEEEERGIDENAPNALMKAVQANVLHGVNLLKTSEPVLREKVEKGELEVVGAICSLDNGKVDLIK